MPFDSLLVAGQLGIDETVKLMLDNGILKAMLAIFFECRIEMTVKS